MHSAPELQAGPLFSFVNASLGITLPKVLPFELDRVSESYTVWTSPFMCHSFVAWTSENFIAHVVRNISDLEVIATETLVFVDQDAYASDPKLALPDAWNKFLWLNSPIAVIHDWIPYLDSLTAKRRYKLKQALDEYACLTTDIVQAGDLDKYTPFVHRNLSLRFPDFSDYTYAMNQWLWFVAVFKQAKHSALLQVVTKGGRLVALTYHIVKVNQDIPCVYFQGIVKDEDVELPNIGTYCLAKVIQALPGLGISHFDPTCRTSLYESSVDTYKRVVVNTNCVKPLLYATSSEAELIPPYYSAGSWFLSETPNIIFDGV